MATRIVAEKFMNWIKYFLFFSFSVAASGCVSTEELYAEYDAQLCEIVVDNSVKETIKVRDVISNTFLDWEPAIYFDFDNFQLSESEQKKLDSTLTVLNKFPKYLLSMQGFTDSQGSRSYNKKLALKRIQSVSQYLTEKGIAESRLVAQSLGEGLPAFGTENKESRAVNRRVELMLLDNTARPVKRTVRNSNPSTAPSSTESLTQNESQDD